MTTILLGVVVFVFVIVALVLVLMVAKSKLVPSGDVTITINDDPDKAMTAQAGSTLLNTPCRMAPNRTMWAKSTSACLAGLAIVMECERSSPNFCARCWSAPPRRTDSLCT